MKTLERPKDWFFRLRKSVKRKDTSTKTVRLTLEMCERYFEERGERLMVQIVRGALETLASKGGRDE